MTKENGTGLFSFLFAIKNAAGRPYGNYHLIKPYLYAF